MKGIFHVVLIFSDYGVFQVHYCKVCHWLNIWFQEYERYHSLLSRKLTSLFKRLGRYKLSASCPNPHTYWHELHFFNVDANYTDVWISMHNFAQFEIKGLIHKSICILISNVNVFPFRNYSVSWLKKKQHLQIPSMASFIHTSGLILLPNTGQHFLFLFFLWIQFSYQFKNCIVLLAVLLHNISCVAW